MLSTHFYENIIRKGYLVFDSDELLSIKDSVTRSIYTMITKWRNSKTYLRRPAFHIARRIPLAWGKSSTRKTVLKIEKSLKELKEFGYITNFNFIKGTKVDNSEFEIFFSEEHNKNKQIIFYDEKADFDKIIHLVEERQNDFELPQLINNETNLKIIEIFGIKGKNLKTLGSVVEEALKTYDYKYVLYSAEYTMINAKVSLLKYFKDTLTNNWADEYIAKKIVLEEKKEPLKKLNIEEATIIEEVPKFTWEEFENSSIEEQERITGIAYEYFLKKAEAIDNKSMRGIFEKSKKSLIIDISKSHSLRTIEKNLSSNNSEEIFVDNFKNIKELIEIDKETKTSNAKIDEENSIGDITITSIVSYNATGNIAKVEATEITKLSGTLINTTQKVSTYVYNAANQVAKVTQEYSMAGISTQTGIFEYTYSGKNLTKMVFTTKLSLGPIPDVIVTTNYSGYDNKISPTSTLGNNYNEFSMSEKGLGVYGMSNNFTKVEMTESMMGTTTTETVSYTYDSQNYATSMTVSGEKSTFEYMSL
jgi:hypothetical protein